MLVTLEPPTRPIRQEAVEADTYFSPGWNCEYPRIQILTVEELPNGMGPNIPPMRATFQRAQRLRKATEYWQGGLFDN